MCNGLKISQRLCYFINNLFPKIKAQGRGPPLSYSEAEYNWAQSRLGLSLFGQHVNLFSKIVFDAGCGFGGRSVFYAERCELAVGLDINKKGLGYSREFARKKGISNADFILGNVDFLPIRSNTIDVIFMNDVVEHLCKRILIKALNECKRIIKPNARICIEFPPWTSPFAAHLYDFINIPWCQLFFSEETLIHVIRKIETKQNKESTIEEFLNLNHITTKEFKMLIKKINFIIVNFDLHMIKNVKLFRYIPFLNNLFTSRVVSVLSKPQ